MDNQLVERYTRRTTGKAPPETEKSVRSPRATPYGEATVTITIHEIFQLPYFEPPQPGHCPSVWSSFYLCIF